MPPEARDAGIRRHALDRLRTTAAKAAAELGFPDVGALVADRVPAGRSLAAISREAGLHKDWPSRHLRTVYPATADLVADRRAAGLSWRGVAAECGQSQSWVRRRAGPIR